MAAEKPREAIFDAVVVGGGPAGLTAALYLARFHLTVFLADEGKSRAAMIPRSHNQPFWPEGISGIDLLERMRTQTFVYPIEVANVAVEEMTLAKCGFQLLTKDRIIHSQAVIVATGVENLRPKLDERVHDEALASGLLRYCPICDGFEVTDRTLAVVGKGKRVFGEAKFLRSYTPHVAAFPEEGEIGFSPEETTDLQAIGVEVLGAPTGAWVMTDGGWEIPFSGATRRFDSVYPALGSIIRSALAVAVGANASEEGCLIVDSHQRTSVPGLYAAGDVVLGVDQIGHAIGQATVAATTLRNDLCDRGRVARR